MNLSDVLIGSLAVYSAIILIEHVVQVWRDLTPNIKTILGLVLSVGFAVERYDGVNWTAVHIALAVVAGSSFISMFSTLLNSATVSLETTVIRRNRRA